jgi:hypothetical protein
VAMLSWMLRYFRGLHRRHGLQSKWINGVHWAWLRKTICFFCLFCFKGSSDEIRICKC